MIYLKELEMQKYFQNSIDMKSEFWQIQFSKKDKYKKIFNVQFRQSEWNIMSFRLKNAPSKFSRFYVYLY